jgi:hypothetical protein
LKTRGLLIAVLTLAFTYPSFATTLSSCADNPGSPTNVQGTLYTAFTCNLYNDVDTYSIDLTPYLTEGGAQLFDNQLSPGYIVVINGDPNSLSDDNSGLYNESLWETVLYWPGDTDGGYASKSLTVDWAGAFPDATTVQSFDQTVCLNDGYDAATCAASDSDFFIESTGTETVYSAYPNTYNVIATPEPSSFLLLGTGLAMFGSLATRKRGAGGQA